MKSTLEKQLGTTLILAFALGCSLLLPAWRAAGQDGVVLSGFGSANIDGRVSRGEWDAAGSMEIAVNLPEGGATPGRIYAMNDSTNLYLAVRFVRSFVDAGNTAAFELDKDNSGNLSQGDDILILNPEVGFVDGVRTTNPPCPAGSVCGLADTDLGGQNDGAAAFHNDGVVTAYEFSHPLRSPDVTNDIQLATGQSIQFTIFLRLLSVGGLADTDLQPAGTIVIAPEPLIRVGIDIRPGESPNNVNPKSRGKIMVAILSSAVFNAPTLVDPSSLTFGSSGDEASFVRIQNSREDVNGDGLPDLVCHFSTEQARFQAADTRGVLKGKTRSGLPIQGSDTIRIVP